MIHIDLSLNFDFMKLNSHGSPSFKFVSFIVYRLYANYMNQFEMFHHSALILTDKPPIEELHQFLEFQLPRQWAPVFSDLPLGPQWKQRSSASLQFSFMGPRLYVNTIPVIFIPLDV